MNKTKIVCTIGPATSSEEALRELHAVGMDMARLNGSHADLDWHRGVIARLRKVLPTTPILMDIPGRKIRTVQLKHEPSFREGETIILTTDQSHDGTQKVPVNYANLHRDLAAGNTVLADDGTLKFTVEKVEGQDIHLRAEGDGTLRSRKGINVPFVNLQTAPVTDRDRSMLAFCVENGVDYVGISFVESGAHVEEIKKVIGGASPRVVAKVENRGGLAHVDEIARVSDALMIDRGDLSVETSIEDVVLNQKRVIEVARSHAKPVIVATEMLHTMIEQRFPTKAEVSDITNAVLDGCAATMLSGETAVGSYWRECVALMRSVVDKADAFQHPVAETAAKLEQRSQLPDAVEDAVALLCRQLPISKIVTISVSGFAAERISSRRPRQEIICASNDPRTVRATNLLHGTRGVFVDIPFSKTTTDHIPACLKALFDQKEILPEDLIIVIAVGYPKSGNRMNLIQTHVVSDLADTLGWSG